LTARLGLELLSDRAVAVAVDPTGRVIGRGQVASKDLSAAALAALDGAAAGISAAPPAVVAAFDPESPSVQAAMTALSRRMSAQAVSSGSAAAVAESWIGAARDVRDLVFFAVGERTSAGILRDGVPLVGAHRRAAAAAWLALNPVEREDYRKMGCLEAEVAAAGIVRRLVWRIKAGDHSRVQEAVNGDLSAITAEHVLDAARYGDGVAVAVVRDTAKYAGMAAANFVVVVDPAVLVLGGVIASAADVLLELVRAEITRRVPAATLQQLRIVPAALGVDAPAIGAAKLAEPAVP
jgi:glucokinase